MSASNFYGSGSAESLPYELQVKKSIPNGVRILFFKDEKKDMVLMTEESGKWDLPNFHYKSGITAGMRSRRVCRDFAKWLGQPYHMIFVVELLGSDVAHFAYDLKEGKVNHVYDLKLAVLENVSDIGTEPILVPAGAEWKDLSFISSLVDLLNSHVKEMGRPDKIDERTKPLEVVMNCLSPEHKTLSSITEPRLQFGWYKKASEFLKSTIKANGHSVKGEIIQLQTGMTATVLEADTEGHGKYFLKAPVRGCDEINITKLISSLFPDECVEITATCATSEYFITREVRIGWVPAEDATLAIGRIQLRSVSVVTELKEGGCPVRDLDTIVKTIEEWIHGRARIQEYSPGIWFGRAACYLMYLCRKLKEYSIPMTLVHGDFAAGNVAYTMEETERVVFYDWEYACISHPFFEFHRYRDKWLEGELNAEVIEKYLELWTRFETMERLRQAYEISGVLSRFVRVCSLFERAQHIEYQEFSNMASWFRSEMVRIHGRAQKRKEGDVEYKGSKEAELEKVLDIFTIV